RNLANVSAQYFHSLRRECVRCKLPGARVRRSVQKQHLLYHYLRNRSQRVETYLRELFGRGGTFGGIVIEHRDNVAVTRNHPGVQERIPVDGILAAQAMEQWIRVGQYPGIEQMVEAEGSIFSRCNRNVRRSTHSDSTYAAADAVPPSSRRASSSVMASNLAINRPSTSEESLAAVGASNRLFRVSSTPN